MLEAPCECDGTLSSSTCVVFADDRAERGGGGRRQQGDALSGCKALYTTRPSSFRTSRIGSRSRAHRSPPDSSGLPLGGARRGPRRVTLARAPAWLRWEISRKRRHWHRAVFLLTRVDDAGSDYGDDIIIGVNITRVRSESDDIEERREFKPEDAEGLTSSDSDSDSASDPEEDARPRRRRRRLHESSDNSSESIGPDGPIHSHPDRM